MNKYICSFKHFINNIINIFFYFIVAPNRIKMKRLLPIIFLLFFTARVAAQADLVVINTDYTGFYVPGENSVYTLAIINNGPNPATNVTINYPIPAGVNQFSWTGFDNSSGNNVPLSVTIPSLSVGGIASYTITVGVPTGFSGNLVAQANVGSTTPDPEPFCANCTDVNVRAAQADIAVVNTNNQSLYLPGSTSIYTLTVTNNGPIAALNVNVSNAIPPGVSLFSWTGSNGTFGTNQPVSDFIPNLPKGTTITYTITIQIPPTFTGNLTSQAIVNSTTPDPTPSCPQCTDTDIQKTGADLVINNTNNQTVFIPGTTSVYMVTVLNEGPQPATGVNVQNAIPAGITQFSWTGSNGSSGTNVSLNNTIPTLAVNASVTYTITVQIPLTFTGNLTSQTVVTSTTSDPNPVCPLCVDTDVRANVADIVVVNTNNQNAYVPGVSSTYTLTVTNNGPDTATNVVVTNPIPTGIAQFLWSGNGTNGNTGLINTIPSLLSGESVIYTINAQAALGSTANIVSVANAIAETADIIPGCVQCSDTDILAVGADVVVVNTNNSDFYLPGSPSIYTITVTNNGPATATGIQISNLIPAGISQFSWVGSNGSNGTDIPLNNTIPTLSPGASVSYSVTVQVPSTYSGSLTMETTFTTTSFDPNPGCLTCVDVDYFELANIIVTNSDFHTVYIAGTTSVYTLRVSNAGPADAQNVHVVNPIPPGITQFSWTGSNGTSGTNVNLDDMVLLLANGEQVVYVITIFVPIGYTGDLINQAIVTSTTDDPVPACPLCTDINAQGIGADLQIRKTDNATTYTAGKIVEYDITIRNNGPSNAVNVNIQDVVPAGIDPLAVTWTGPLGIGLGNINEVIPVINVGQTIAYHVVLPVPSGFPQNTNLINAVSVTSDTPDPRPLCTVCTDSDLPSPLADIVVLKSNNQPGYLNNEETTYNIIITNNGPSDALNVAITDNMPPNISQMTWEGSDGTFGSGNLQTTIPVLISGQVLIYTVKMKVPVQYSTSTGNLTNVVDVISMTPDPFPNCVLCTDIDFPRPPYLTVDLSTYGERALVKDVLVRSDCANVSNITSSASLSAGAASGIGYFHRNNSDFPFKEGVILRSGNATATQGPFTGSSLSTTGSNLQDSDLQIVSDNAGGTENIVDASFLNFNFTPFTDNFKFRFLFASNEYGALQCSQGDAFAFLLTDLTSGAVTNIAVIPSTTNPINVTTIRDSQFNALGETCSSQNAGLFGSYNADNPADAAINFVGQTLPMTASATVIPNRPYSIKLVIGDYRDSQNDSAIFIEAGSFNAGQLDFGPDLTFAAGTALCSEPLKTLKTELDPNVFDFVWTKDGNVISTETGPSLQITQNGEYGVTATDGFCEQSASVKIEIYQPLLPVTNLPIDLTDCGTFDLNNVNASILGSIPPANYTFKYFHTSDDAKNNVGAISDPANYPGIDDEVIFVRVENATISPCYSSIGLFFTLHVNCPGVPEQPENVYECDQLPNDGYADFNLNLDHEVLGTQNLASDYTITYHSSQLHADNDSNPIGPTYTNTIQNRQTIYVRMENVNDPLLFSTTSFDIVVLAQPVAINQANVAECDSYTLPPLPSGSTYHNATGGEASTLIIGPITSSQKVFIYSQVGTAPDNCFAEGSFDVTIYITPQADTVPNGVGCSGSYVLPALTIGNYFSQTNGRGRQYFAGETITTNMTMFVYARSGNATKICATETSFDIRIFNSPVLNPSGYFFRKCDDNNNGIACFDLNLMTNSITNGFSNLGVSYHETSPGAQNGTNAIDLTRDYCNINADSQKIFVRVFQTAAPSCAVFTTLDLIVNPVPVSPILGIIDYPLCDNNSRGDLIEGFILSTKDAEIINSQPGVTVTYYRNEPDAIGKINPIDKLLPFNTVSTVVWVRLEFSTGCYTVDSFNLVVNPLPIVPIPALSYTLCDIDNPGDQKEEFDLSTRVNGILNGQTGMDVTFHFDQNDADTGNNPLNLLYRNVVLAVQTIYVRVYNRATTCYSTTTLDLRVQPLPSPIAPPGPIVLCDPDGNGFADFDLDALTADMLMGDTTTIITYHELESDALSGINAINTSTDYTNIVTLLQYLFVRAESTLGEKCVRVIRIELNVIPSPVVPPLDNQAFAFCDQDASDQDGFTQVDLTGQETKIFQANAGSATGYTIEYFDDPIDADAGTSPIIDPEHYTNTVAFTQEIWVRISDNATTCYNIDSFIITIEAPLALPLPLPTISMCDDGPTTAIPQTVFDLTIRENLINPSGLPGYVIDYFPSDTDALAGTNRIATPEAYTNIANAQSIGVRVTSTAGCLSYTTMDIRVMPLPTVNDTNIPAIEDCAGSLFDLTQYEPQIRNNDTGLVFEYYPTLTDAENQTNQIPDPQNHPATGDIYIRVSNAGVDYLGENCYVIVVQPVTVNPLPIVNPITLKECDANGDGFEIFNLAEKNAELLGNTQDVADFTISYYRNPTDAGLGNNPILSPGNYRNLTNPQDIYVRVVNNLTGCVNATGIITLEVLDGATVPTPVTPLEIATCDDDGNLTPNGQYEFDLTQFESTILNGQDPLLFTVDYFANLADAGNNANAIANPDAYVSGSRTVYAVVTNNTTQCRSDFVEITLEVEPLASPEIISDNGGNTICVNFTSGALERGLTLDSQITGAGYTFQWYFNGQPIAVGGQGRTYSITDASGYGDYSFIATSTSALGCDSDLVSFTVIRSGAPEAMSPPYTVTNAFADEQTITATVLGYGDYVYKLDDGPWESNNGVFTNVGPGVHTVYVKDNNVLSCPDILEFGAISIIDYPRYFTPNGDGIHDTWNIIGLDQIANDAKIYIFDRYGKLIKQIAPTTNGTGGWDGTYNGHPMPSTDYWFKVEFTEPGVGTAAGTLINREFRAHFSLKR